MWLKEKLSFMFKRKTLWFSLDASFEFQKFSCDSLKGGEEKEFQLYGLKIPGKYMKSIVFLFHDVQLQSICLPDSGVLTREVHVQQWYNHKEFSREWLTYSEHPIQKHEKEKCKHAEFTTFPLFSYLSPGFSEWVYLDCITTCTIIWNNIKTSALQSHFSRILCSQSSNKFCYSEQGHQTKKQQ